MTEVKFYLPKRGFVTCGNAKWTVIKADSIFKFYWAEKIGYAEITRYKIVLIKSELKIIGS